MTVTGIDGYPRGWVAARLDPDLSSPEVHWTTCEVSDIASLLHSDDVVGIDMPIGLADRGWRDCDHQARAALGRARSRVFLTPPRAVLALGLSAPNSDVQSLSRELTGQGTSRQAMGLAERILALDAALAASPGSGTGTVIEVHPELSFAEMGGRPLASKKSASGVGERLEALSAWIPDPAAALARAPHDVPVDDALDALACAWTAQRWGAGTARTLPPYAEAAPRIII
jgi:predicted RNase H-like nuclease